MTFDKMTNYNNEPGKDKMSLEEALDFKKPKSDGFKFWESGKKKDRKVYPWMVKPEKIIKKKNGELKVNTNYSNLTDYQTYTWRKYSAQVRKSPEFQFCKHCGTHLNIVVDHIIELDDSKRDEFGVLIGMFDLQNLQPLCKTCNNIKGVIKQHKDAGHRLKQTDQQLMNDLEN